MFQGSRNHFRTAWTGLRDRGTLRLFAFEFVVVVLGVLVAQGLANWADQRTLQAKADTDYATNRRELGYARETFAIWQAALPCLTAQTRAVLKNAGGDGPIDTSILQRPTFVMTNVTTLDAGTREILRQRYGDAWLLAIDIAAEDVRGTASEARSIAAEWYQFSRLDPANGRVTQGDRNDARRSAATILASLRRIQILTDAFEATMPQLGNPPLRQSFAVGSRARPIRSCEEMVRNASISVPVT